MSYRGRVFSMLAILSAMLLFSCNSNTYYNESFTLPEYGWVSNNAVGFNVDVPDSLAIYNFAINIRNTTEYRYSNLYVFLITEFPNGNVSRDTLEVLLADINGSWLGKGWGKTKENVITLRENLRFPVGGKYNFYIQQAMRTDTLTGISDVGIKISNEQ